MLKKKKKPLKHNRQTVTQRSKVDVMRVFVFRITLVDKAGKMTRRKQRSARLVEDRESKKSRNVGEQEMGQIVTVNFKRTRVFLRSPSSLFAASMFTVFFSYEKRHNKNICYGWREVQLFINFIVLSFE